MPPSPRTDAPLPAAPVPSPGPRDPAVRRARWSLMALFALFGVVGTSWLSRLPSVRAGLDVTTAQLGLLLVTGAVGALLAVVATGAVVARYGSRTTLVAATATNVVGLLLVAAGVGTGSVGLFAVGAFINGVSGALMNVPINLNAAVVEQHLGRAVLPHFHAAFSVGAALGALVAAAFSAAHVGIAVQLVVVTLAVAVARGVLLVPATALAPERTTSSPGPADDAPHVARPAVAGADPDVDAAVADTALPGGTASTASTDGTVVAGAAAPVGTDGTADPDGTEGRRRGGSLRTALGAWREPRTVLIGLVLLASSLSEGSAGNWLSLAVSEGFAVREAVGALAYATFVVAMTVFRFAGTRVIDRFGRVTVLRASGVSSLVGLLLFGLSPSIVVAWVGIVLWGCGAALANPIAVSAASDEPRRAAGRVAVVTSFSSVAQLTAPPVLGLLADTLGERHALLTICAAVVLSLVVSGQVRPLPGSPAAASGR